LEKRLRVSIDDLLEGVQLIDRDWRYVYVNAKAAEHGQRPVNELVGRTLMDCYPEIEQTHLFAALRRVMDSRCAESLRTTFSFSTGESRWFDVQIDPVPDGICVLSLDVTERVRADEGQALMAAIVTSSDDAIISTTLDGIVLSWNAGAEHLYELPASEMIGKSYMPIVPQDKQSEFASSLRRVAAGERVHPYQTERLRRNGSRIDILLTVSPVRDASGHVTATSGIARDITDQKIAEAELQRLNDEIQLQRLRVFKATMTTVHDILNNFLNNLQLVRIEAEDRLPIEILHMFDGMIDEAADNLKRLGNLNTVQEKQMAAGLGIDY